ncbi:MAG: PAS domain S-box protein [Actinomycetota bacterium]|nr:PAS domain S-box protein [Actinomycetota bacterium]
MSNSATQSRTLVTESDQMAAPVAAVASIAGTDVAVSGPDATTGVRAGAGAEVEQSFGFDELFVTTTDLNGHILLSNSVFDRMSGYRREELLGRGHDIVRHPDMPRSIFSIFWERLQRGDRAVAYVKNRARDGSFYWVMVVAGPVPGGYASVHMRPSTSSFITAQEIYPELLALEHEVENGDVRRREDAIRASSVRLGELLAQAGFPDYQAFMYTLLPAEVDAREQQLAGRSRAPGRPSSDQAGTLQYILDRCAGVEETLSSLASGLQPYGELGARLSSKSKFMADLSDGIRLFSLNAMLAASRLREGAAIGAVANILGRRSDEAGPVIASLSAELQQTEALMRQMNFRIAAGKLQVEMVEDFLAQIADEPDRLSQVGGQLAALGGALADSVGRLSNSQSVLDRHLDTFGEACVVLVRHLRVLQALVVNGRIEASHLSGADDVVQLFAEIGQRVEAATAEMRDFAEAMRRRPARQNAQEQAAQAEMSGLQAAISALADDSAAPGEGDADARGRQVFAQSGHAPRRTISCASTS